MEESRTVLENRIFGIIYNALQTSTYVGANRETIVTGARAHNLAKFLSGKLADNYLQSPIEKKNMQPSEDYHTNEYLYPIPRPNVVGIKLNKGAIVPQYATPGSAGFDLVANFVNESSYEAYANGFKKQLNKDYFLLGSDDDPEAYRVVILPGCAVPIPTGIYMEIPEDMELQIRPRSGIAIKNGLSVINSPGTIDSDYRGEIVVLLYNSSNYPQIVAQGMKVAQAILAPYNRANFIITENLSDTSRGTNGFNSTGTSISNNENS